MTPEGSAGKVSNSWHDQMTEAVNLRKKAMNGVTRWQEKLAEAESVIEELSANRNGAVPADIAEEAALLTPDLAPVFGASGSGSITISQPYGTVTQ